jgi:hypothetical protein
MSRPLVLRCVAYLALAAVPCALLAQTLPEVFLTYSIEVSLDPETRELDGRLTARWTNPSATVAVDRVPLHLYLNGFANQASTWMQTRNSARDDFDIEAVLELHDDPWGWIEPRAIRQDGGALAWRPIAPDDGNPLDRSLIEAELATPVAPGATLTLEVEFDARLPVPIARTGGYDDFFLVAQWFPKIAVFEKAGTRGAATDGWNAHQFHGPTEFYADYADFDVNIGLPADWSVVATGQKAGETERDGLSFHRYTQRAVHDFAFATGSAMVDVVSSHDPAGPGAPVEVHVFAPAGREAAVARWRESVTGALDVLGARVGPYPYATITLVQPPFRQRQTGGMEYPTLFTGLFDDAFWDLAVLDGVRLNELAIVHEFAHQYFYGLVGSNEFEEAFLDEGMTEYWGNRVMVDTYVDGAGSLLGRPLDVWHYESIMDAETAASPPIGIRPSFVRGGLGSVLSFYSRPAAVLRTIENRHGRTVLDAIFAEYFARWRFRHPRFEDFVDVAREIGGDAVGDLVLDAYFQATSPDFAIDDFSVDAWEPPLGRVVTADGVIASDTPADERAPLAEALAGESGTIVVERVDSGDASGRPGAIERFTVTPEAGEPEEGWEADDDEHFVSRVRVSGPAWRALPVDVEFRFADGAIYRDAWDGRSAQRVYTFVRAAPLSSAALDPGGAVALDPNRANNSRQREPDNELAWGWAFWIGGTAQLLLEGLSQWL